MVAVLVFSGLTRAICALASAEAMAAMLSLALCMDGLPLQHVKAHRAGFGPLAADAMPDGFLGFLWHQGLELAFGALVVKESPVGVAEQPSEFAPGVRRAHVHHADRIDARPGRLCINAMWRLARLDTAPELLFCGNQYAQIERVYRD